MPSELPNDTPNYTYRAEWDNERREYQARCLEFPGRFAAAFTAHEAVQASPTLHARLVVEASEEGVSLNQWVVAKLADRPRAFSMNDLFD